MRNRVISIVLIVCILLSCTGCSKVSKESTFSIHFIDVGQGDAALIECDGEYMLIDGGDTSAGDKVYDVLKNEGVDHLNILVASHLHADHIGGLVKALTYVNQVDLTLSNADNADSKVFREFESRVLNAGSEITVPDENREPYKLGSAEVKIIDAGTAQGNDSLVLLITYGDTHFLFTGDIEKEAQSRVAGKLREVSNELKKGEVLIKMPHHGAYNSDILLPNTASDNSLATLVSAAYAKYFVISVGKNNQYNHPDDRTLDIIDQAISSYKLDETKHFMRTDINGDLIAMSNGKSITLREQE